MAFILILAAPAAQAQVVKPFKISGAGVGPLGLPLPGQAARSHWVEALFVADFVPMSDRCTGRFAGVSGSWLMIARTEPFVLGSTDPVYYSWEGDGSLTFQN